MAALAAVLDLAQGGGEGEDYGDPTMETPAPEPTITPGEGFSEEGNLVTRDLLYDEHTNKQFITVQTSGGNTFYIVIDYDKPVDEEGEQYETYFFSVVDEGDLLAAAEAAGVEQAVCSCPEKCAAGSFLSPAIVYCLPYSIFIENFKSSIASQNVISAVTKT